MEGINKIENLISNAKEYAETRYELALLNIQDKIAELVSSIASLAVIGILSVFVLFFLSAGAAWWIGSVTNNPSMGFFCIAGFYLLLTVVIYLSRNSWIKLPIINAIIKKIKINEED